jgi:hypothetical protein
MAIVPVAIFTACTTSQQTIAFQSIATVEAGVIAANGAYLDSVVTGLAPTNGIPTVEAAFNDTQLALRTAASLASGGSSAPVPAATFTKAVNFTNTITANSVKH